jgi:thiopurine S-methyltransferase
MEPPRFPRLDPADPAFWDVRYEARLAPWDAGRVPGRLREYAGARTPGSVLVPGCGSAWDARFLDEAGWKVTAIDFSAQAIAAARDVLGDRAFVLRQADFFAPIAEAPFDLAYERAFLCALPRRLWADWGRRLAQLVRPGGELAGFFLFDAGERGPPFPLHSGDELEALLAPGFARIEDLPVSDSIGAFEGKERWQRWRRAQ